MRAVPPPEPSVPKILEVELPPAREATSASRAVWFKFRSAHGTTSSLTTTTPRLHHCCYAHGIWRCLAHVLPYAHFRQFSDCGRWSCRR
ncbi:hypothetical protein BDZ89DRAFT_1079764 [Hymenopellis radicata]|nr:hypothetical protein BDZ89DRAFT_1079764 [Hymenopellis radicata]